MNWMQINALNQNMAISRRWQCPVVDQQSGDRNIYGKIIDLEIELSRLSKIYKAKHPQIVQTQSELQKSRKSLSQEIAKEVENLKSERRVLLAREQALEQNIGEFEAEAWTPRPRSSSTPFFSATLTPARTCMI